MASYHDGISMKCEILNIQKWCIVFFLHPKKTAEIFRKSHFFLPSSGFPDGKAARHISGPGFGDGWTDKEARTILATLAQNKLEIVLKNEFKI